MKFLHLNLEFLSSETDKHWRSSKKYLKITQLLFNHNFNEDKVILFTFYTRKRKKKKIKQNSNYNYKTQL